MNTRAEIGELLRLARQGDEGGFRQIYRLFSPKVRGTLHHLTGPDSLDDLEQEVFLRIWRNLGKIKSDAAFSTWVYRLTYNVAMDARRTMAQARARYAPESSLMVVGDSRATIAPTDARMLVETALAALDPEHRAVVVLADLEELPLAQVGQALDIPVGTVKSRLFYARSHMRKALAKEGVNV